MDLLHEKIELMAAQEHYSAGLLNRFSDFIANADDWDLYRINPYRLAEILGYGEHEVLELMIHGARAGLLDFTWSMVCPSCGEIQNNDHSLDNLSREFHCEVCQFPVTVTMDETVEVTFSVTPGIRRLDLNPFSSMDTYRRFYFSDGIERSPEMLEYMGSIWQGFEVIEPDDTFILDRDWAAGASYRMVSAGVHKQFIFHIDEKAGNKERMYDLDFDKDGITPKEIRVHTTRPVFRISNHLSEAVGLMIVEADFPTLHRTMKNHPSSRKAMLTGTTLLGNRKFRDAFKIDRLSPSLKLNIRSLTLLFTDLKGSTELYNRTGDIQAYQLIQDHFRILGDIVARNSGAVIKTMGDAIMATFSSPAHAVKAGDEMIRAMKDLHTGDGDLELKVGIHEGPALAISNMGYLDYFGQTVNIAARIQALAKPGSIWISDTVLQGKNVKRYLGGQGFTGKRYSASLKGVEERTVVYGLQRSRKLAGKIPA